VAPKSLPHKITVPGLSALFGSAPKSEAAPAPAETVHAPAPVSISTSVEPVVPAGEGSPAPTAAAQAFPATPAPAQPPSLAPALHATRPAPVRKMSKGVRVTQPEVEGKPKGRHTLVIDEAVLEELSLLAWAENMSVSAIAREAFDAYLGSRRKAVLQARELRDSFGRKREAI